MPRHRTHPRGDDRPRRLLAVTDYAIDIDLTRGAQRFASTTVVRFSCTQPGAGSFIDLIAPQVREVVLNGVPLSVEEVVTAGRIALPDLAADNELRVSPTAPT